MTDRELDITDVGAAVEAQIGVSALKIERAISLARILYGSALLVFTLNAADLYGEDSVIVSSIPLGVFVAASVVLLLRLPVLRNPSWVFPMSVAMDASVAFVSLLPDVLWPWPGYPGMINLISASGMLISTFAAGFRLSVRVAVFGSVLNAAYFVILMLLDHSISGHPAASETPQVVLFAIFLFGAAALAVVLAVLTHRVVERGARAAVLADRARRRLDQIVQDHHDLRSALTSVTLCAGMIKEQLSGVEAEPLMSVQALADKLLGEMKKIKTQIDLIKGQTFSELMALKQIVSVPVAPVIEEVLDRTRELFPRVEIKGERLAGDLSVAVAGGRPILERILFNLLVNACEGDGSRGASRVEIGVRAVPGQGQVRVEISDDGPGFPEHMLVEAVGERMLTTKAGGSGFGLLLVKGLVKASSGAMAVGNRAGGGGRVTIELRTKPEPG